MSTIASQVTRKLRVAAVLVFETGWRIGSGRAGQTSDLGVMLDTAGSPILPGSSLKGRLRNTCESLASALGLTACLLDQEASCVACVSDVSAFSQKRGEHRRAIEQGVAAQLAWIDRNTCDVCKLFGSPVRAARLRCADGKLLTSPLGLVRVRDGVVLDRDSHTAVDGLKYDYECVSPDARFRVTIDVDDPRREDEALLGAAMFEWAAGSSLGGFTSRGLGRFHLEEIDLCGVDLKDAEQRKKYLLGRTPQERLAPLGDWQAYFQEKINSQLAAAKG
jgi:CRISPR-associated RAMP protein (TIGR02581 family)